MAITAKIDVNAKDILGSLQGFLKNILGTDEIQSLLVPQHLPMKNMVMPTLVTDPNHLNGVDPLSPAFPMNAAKIVSRLTRKPMGAKVAAVLRPCEIRAFVELVKLKQGRTEEVILIGVDCLGAFQNKDYFQLVEQNAGESTAVFLQNVLHGKSAESEGLDLAPACKACEYPVADNADILIGLYGLNVDKFLMVQSQTEAGDQILKQMNLSTTDAPRARQDAINAVITQRTRYRDDMFAKTREAPIAWKKCRPILPPVSTATTVGSPARFVTARNAFLLPMYLTMNPLSICSGPSAKGSLKCRPIHFSTT
jgi:formate dehydrogenase subunit beta